MAGDPRQRISGIDDAVHGSRRRHAVLFALAGAGGGRNSRTTRSQDDVPFRLWSTGFWISRILAPPRISREPSQAATHTHFISGFTSQLPLARTPPQGPLRSDLGQFIGQDMPVEDSAHCPHI